LALCQISASSGLRQTTAGRLEMAADCSAPGGPALVRGGRFGCTVFEDALW